MIGHTVYHAGLLTQSALFTCPALPYSPLVRKVSNTDTLMDIYRYSIRRLHTYIICNMAWMCGFFEGA